MKREHRNRLYEVGLIAARMRGEGYMAGWNAALTKMQKLAIENAYDSPITYVRIEDESGKFIINVETKLK